MKTPLSLEKAILITLSLTLLASRTLMGYPSATHLDPPPKVLLDLKTNVMYYLEPDLRHIDAINPKSKLLWRCQVIPTSAIPISARPQDKIALFRFHDRTQRIIDVWFTQGGIPSFGVIDNITGAFTFRGSD
jgi:hypothetical protein